MHHNHHIIGITVISDNKNVYIYKVKHIQLFGILGGHLPIHRRHFCLDMKLLSAIGLMLPPPSANGNLSEPNIPRYFIIIHSVFVYIFAILWEYLLLYL